MIQLYKNGLTIKELIKFITENINDIEDGEIWIETGDCLSSPCIEVSTLNKNDILVSVKEFS